MLIRPKLLLDLNEDIIFPIPGGGSLEYRVDRDFLDNTTRRRNNAMIFEVWKKDKHLAATMAYGYRSGGGDCPTCRSGDYFALTRLYWLILSWSLVPKELPSIDQFINPGLAFKALPKYDGWRDFGFELPRVVSLITQADFTSWSPAEILRMM